MESLIQEAYEQIPVYLRNGRDMNRKKEQAGGLEDYPVLERNQLIEEETAVLMPWAEMLRMQGKLICGRTPDPVESIWKFSGPGKISQIHAAIVVLSL